MVFNAYYQDELSYLRELGADFASSNPRLSMYLGRDAQDPDVERLLEGFAFLVARLRQRLDDEFPELVHGLLRLIWPHYLRVVPPSTIVSFRSTRGGDTVVEIPKNTGLLSESIDGTSCRFRTCYHVHALPLAIENVDLDNRPGRARLTFLLRSLEGGSLAALSGGTLRLFLNPERDPAAMRLLMAGLLRHVESITCRSDTGASIEIGQAAVRAVGFTDEETVIPYPDNAFAGFRTVQEYFATPDKFLFVDINGFETIARSGGSLATVNIAFKQPFPETLRISDTTLCLNCTPAINLFETNAQPIRIENGKTEYRLRVAGDMPATIHSIRKVTGFPRGGGEPIDFVSFESMRHDLPGATGGAFFREKLRPAVIGRGHDHYVTFVSRRDVLLQNAAGVITVSVEATNGNLAERLPVGSLNVSAPDTPAGLSFSNITPVVSEIHPPVGDALLWRLVSNLARNYGSLADAGALRGLLASYDFRAVTDAQARRRLELLLEGIERFETTPGDTVIRGVPVRVRQIVLHVNESKIGGPAEMFLLGSVLDHLLQAYAGINNLLRFSIRGTETSLNYTWPIRTGTLNQI